MILKEKTAIVTGGSSGLGEAVARRLAKQGVQVVITDVSDKQGESIASAIGADYRHCDVSNEAEVQRAIQSTMTNYGKLDIVVNVAGVNIPKKLVSKNGVYPLSEWMRIVQINLVGTFNFIRFGVEAMLKHEPYEDGDRGVFVNTSSVSSFHGQAGQTAYSASKAGINGMMLPAAREFQKQAIRFMAIAPGLFHTAIYDKLEPAVLDGLLKQTIYPKRLGIPDEFAHAVQMIIENPMFNGDTIRLDGALRF
jgi:NAD(P)-dependent dehydrogenase (short-subunit alcohol dehydrogenase family)